MKNSLLVALLLITVSSFSQSSKDSEWDDWFMPGVAYKSYIPKNSSDLGVYHGVMTEFVIYARAKGSESRSSGPSRIKTYGNLSIMSSTQSEAKDIFHAKLDPIVGPRV